MPQNLWGNEFSETLHIMLLIFRAGETTIKIKFSLFEGGGLGGREENRPNRCFFFFRGKRHDKINLKVQILLSRNFVVIAQAPRYVPDLNYPEGPKIEKFQDFAPGLKLSSDQSQIEIFNRD